MDSIYKEMTDKNYLKEIIQATNENFPIENEGKNENKEKNRYIEKRII